MNTCFFINITMVYIIWRNNSFFQRCSLPCYINSVAGFGVAFKDSVGDNGADAVVVLLAVSVFHSVGMQGF